MMFGARRYWIRDEEHQLHNVDLDTWARWHKEQDERGERNLRIVNRTLCPDGTTISTVFLGLDYNFSPSGPPVLFETMIFRGHPDHTAWEYQERATAPKRRRWKDTSAHGPTSAHLESPRDL